MFLTVLIQRPKRLFARFAYFMGGFSTRFALHAARHILSSLGECT